MMIQYAYYNSYELVEYIMHIALANMYVVFNHYTGTS